jgi:signal transduction histidine kinase
MKAGSSLALLLGFGSLIGLIGLLGLGAIQQADKIYDELTAAQTQYLETESFLRDIPADLHLAGILVRDYLLDPSHLMGPYYREQLKQIRGLLLKRLDILEHRTGAEESGKLHQLREEVEGYWRSMDPIFEWSPAQKAALSSIFLRQQVLPRRTAVLDLSQEVARLNRSQLRAAQSRLRQSQEAFHNFLGRITAIALALGVIVAAVSASRVAALEKRNQKQRQATEHAEEEMRRLSNKLVQAQEQERKSLSRELHDAVGQMLTGLRMELANGRIDEARQLAEQTLRAVRDLAMGLRPSMLDDLGVGAALEWQAREFSRRSGVPATVQINGALDALADKQRTCIFRVVQEALTNIARHSQAKSVRVAVHGGDDDVSLTIQDDGIGFDSKAPRSGIGLTGIEERVRELGGSLAIVSQPARGTMLKVDVPAR